MSTEAEPSVAEDPGLGAAAEPSDGRAAIGTTFLVALDGSPASIRALDLALDTASRTGCSVAAAYVVKRISMSGELIGATAAMEQTADELKLEFQQLIRDRSHGREVAVRLEILRGSVLNELLKLAATLDTRAILVGASGHRYVGALAPKIVHSGRWPVTVVP